MTGTISQLVVATYTKLLNAYKAHEHPSLGTARVIQRYEAEVEALQASLPS